MEDDTSVRVAVRIRPQLSREIINMYRSCTSVTPGEPQVVLGSDKAFTFDYVFDLNSVQMLIYETCVQQLIEGCFEGFNATVLAYGQTGSGKTYTMGTGFDVNVHDDELGIIPRAVEHLFEGIEERRQRAYANNEPIPEFKIHCQFMELYNEEIIDLFDTTSDAVSKGKKSSIRIHEDSNGGIYAVGVTTKVVTSKQETLKCLKIGALSRTTASTNMNLQSSRSHAIFTLHMKQQRIAKAKDPDMELDTVNEFETLTAKFHFVDLAGSERLKRTGATGERAREGISINCGLLALGNVISALGDVLKRGSHVPYRDSKLTRLLQDSLGGNSRTLMIACISPSDCDFMETLNTLKYANRARNIRNRVVANQDKNSKTISTLRHEIQLLQLELLEYKQGKRIVVDGEENINDMFHENTMLQTENNNLRVRVKALQETSECLTVKNTQLLTEKATGVWITSGSGDNSDIGAIVQSYIKEVEELRAKYLEAEHTCQMLRRSASRTQTRLSMSPLHSHAVAVSGIYDIGADAHMDGVDEILKEAKKDLEKLREKEKIKKQTRDTEENVTRQRLEYEENVLMPESEIDELCQDDNEMTREDNNEDSSEIDSDEEEEEEDDEQYREDLAELTCEISIKQKLIEELERSQMRLETMRHQYEEKLLQLQAKIRATQEERDKVLANMGNVANVSEGKAKKVKDEYEKKLNDMTNELKKIQAAKKEHARLLKNQGQYEKQLKMMRGELTDMKKAKVRLMNKIKEEANRHKDTEQRRNREIAQLKKESRQKQNQIRTLEAEKKLKEAVLRRKQEEVSALRKMNKPMSDRVAGRLPRSRQQMLIQQSSQAASKKMTFSPKVAKSKWQHLEKDITKLVLNKKAITSWESDMEHFLKGREALSQNLEKQIKKRELSIQERKSSGFIRDLDDQIESMKANIDYIQENISECQANIMQMEESKDGQDLLDVDNLLRDMGEEETKYLLNKLLAMTISQSLLAAQRDANLKEAEAKMQQLEQNNVMQQQLLEHMLKQEGMDLFMYSNGSGGVSSAGSAHSSRSVSPIDGVSMGETMAISSSSTESLKRTRDKARRKTALNPEELLFGGECKIPIVNINDDQLECDRLTETISMSARLSSNQSIVRPVATQATASRTTNRKLSPYSSSFYSSSSAASAQPSTNDIGNSDPTPPTSPTPQRKGREENVFSRLTGGTISSDMARPNCGVIRSFLNTKPIAKSSPMSCTHVAEGHSRSILSVVATDTLLLSASMDRTVKVWDLHSGSEITTLGGHPNSVVVVRYCERTRQIFSVSSTFIKIWDLRDGNTKCIKALHSSGQTAEGSNAVTNQVLTYGTSSRENQINDVVVDSHGQRLFSAAGSLVRIWDLRSYGSVGKLNGGHQAAVTCLAVEDSDGSNSFVVTGSKDHYIKLFEVSPTASGIQQPKFDLEPPHYDGIQTLALGGNVLFSGSRDMCIKKWDLKRAELKQSLNQAHKDWVTGLCFLPSRKGLLSCCRGGYVRLWSVDRCKLLGEVKAHNSPINSLTTNGSCVFTASSDTTVRIWRTRSETDISTENTDFR